MPEGQKAGLKGRQLDVGAQRVAKAGPKGRLLEVGAQQANIFGNQMIQGY